MFKVFRCFLPPRLNWKPGPLTVVFIVSLVSVFVLSVVFDYDLLLSVLMKL